MKVKYCHSPVGLADCGLVVVQTDGRLLTYVVAAGAQYGAEESVFHSLFKVCVITTRVNRIVDWTVD
jgi:hypothetical protein